MTDDSVPAGMVDTPAKARQRVTLEIDKRAMKALGDARLVLTLCGEEVECRAYPREARRHRGVWLVPCDAGLYGFFAGMARADETPAATILRVLAEMDEMGAGRGRATVH